MNIDFIHDKLLVKLFILKKNNRIRYCFHNVMETDKYPCIKNYILNRYHDSLSPQETLRRMKYDIEVRPKCVVCGNNVRYVGKPDSNGLFKQFCSKSCANKYNYEKAKKTKIEKYGSSNNEQKRKQTCLEKYGDENYNNHEQTVRTNIERYGGVAPACNEEIHNKIVETFKKIYSERGDEIDAKKKQTMLERYGNENYRNVDKIKETWANKTDKERNEIKEKTRQTFIDKYGDPGYRNVEKGKQTKFERYGNPRYNNIKKNKETLLKKYGVDSYSKTDMFRKLMLEKWQNTNFREKIYNTKKKNNSFNKSKQEEFIYELLNTLLGEQDIIRQHNTDEYPFNCDFYIKSLDLYIEYQGFYTHNFRPFDKNNKNDVEEANVLLLKYKDVWETWTIRDVKKRETAKKNNLNYIELWSIEEAIIFIIKLLNRKNVNITNDCVIYDTTIKPLNINGQSLSAEYISQLNENETYLLIYEIFKYYNNLEFPVLNLSDDYIYEQLNKLKKFDSSKIYDGNTLSSFGKLCNDVCKHMSGVKYYQAAFDNIISPYDAYNDNEMLLNAIKNRILYQTENNKRVVYQIDHSQIIKGLVNSGISKTVSNFKPTLAKWIYDYALSICETESNVKSTYDYSAGWGGRMLAANSLGIIYNGTDPNTSEELTTFANKFLNNVNVYSYCSESDEIYDKLVEQDIIGSCPPYFKLEQYSEDNSQCYNKYNEYELWLEKYWKETVIKSYKKLKSGGVFFVVINNNLKEDVVKTILENTKLTVHSEFVIKSSKSHLYNKKESDVKNKYNETVIFFKKII